MRGGLKCQVDLPVVWLPAGEPQGIAWSDLGWVGQAFWGGGLASQESPGRRREFCTARLSRCANWRHRIAGPQGPVGVAPWRSLSAGSEGNLAWDRWAGVAENLGLALQTTLGGSCEEEGLSLGWREGAGRAE